MTPQTVNAVNLPLQDALNFPAAILQPPFFDAKAPSAVNYGAIGSVIGHEISHTFDTEGSTFDATGRLRDWWTPADLAHFDAATAKLAAQYDTYMPFPDVAREWQADAGGRHRGCRGNFRRLRRISRIARLANRRPNKMDFPATSNSSSRSVRTGDRRFDRPRCAVR